LPYLECLGYFFVKFTTLGIVGLAISASLANIIQCFGLFALFVWRVDGQGWEKMFFSFSRIVLSSIFCGLTSWLTLRFFDLFVLDTSKTLNVLLIFGLSITSGLFSFLVFAWLFHSPEYLRLKSYFHRFFHFLS